MPQQTNVQLLCRKDREMQKTILDTIAEAFTRAPHASNAAYYVEKDENGGKCRQFWYILAEGELDHEHMKVYFTEDGKVAAMVDYHPCDAQQKSGDKDDSEDMKELMALLRPQGEAVFADAHGPEGYWNKQYSGAAERLGPHYSIEFLAVHPDVAGQGHGRAMLQYILDKADNEDKGVFLVATGLHLRDWYARYGFQQVYYKHYSDDEAQAHLCFMERHAKSKRSC